MSARDDKDELFNSSAAVEGPNACEDVEIHHGSRLCGLEAQIEDVRAAEYRGILAEAFEECLVNFR